MTAEETLKKLRDTLQENQGVVGSEITGLIHELSTKVFSISIDELCDFILSDVTLTAKIISTANKIEFNFAMRPISTVTEAIQLIGFTKVRNLTLTLLMIENAELAKRSTEPRRVVSLVLCSSLFARSLFKDSHELDPEHVFICSSLRHYGRVVLSAICPSEYREVLGDKLLIADDRDFERKFGIDPISISRNLLESSKIPNEILFSVQRCPFSYLQGEALSAKQKLLVAIELAEEVSALVLDSRISHGDYEIHLAEILEKYEKVEGFKELNIASRLTATVNAMKGFFRSYGFNSFLNPYLSVIEARVAMEDPDPIDDVLNLQLEQEQAAEKELLVQQKPSIADLPTGVIDFLGSLPLEDHSSKKRSSAEIFSDGLREMSQLIEHRTIPVDRILKLAMEILHEALNLDDCVVFIRTNSTETRYVRFTGTGTLFEYIPQSLTLKNDDKDLLMLCDSRKELIHLKDLTLPALREYLPSWLRNTSIVATLLFFPVVYKHSVRVIFFASKKEKDSLQMNEENMSNIRKLHMKLSSALSLKDKQRR